MFYLTSVHSLGPEALQGVQYLSGYYWDRDDESRAFAKRYEAKSGGKKPDHNHAAVYSAVKHFLKAVEETGSLDGLTVMRKMKEMPLDDFYARGAKIRPDGRLMNDMLLVEVKAPDEVRGEWDLVKIRQVVKADDIMRPLSEGGCKHLDPAPAADGDAGPAAEKK
ncbi:ABC transporter substrate-binding protein [Camelimonas abortus]|uniref:ABC transporter substrate-binding protein n=1 Tax=Camelimonas abortus TaxID=1017184 RepID=A0ABV7LFW9_9HYPH